MKTTSWLRRLTGGKKRARRPRQRFSERFAATLSIKPLESRLVLNATQLDLSAAGFLTLNDTSPNDNDLFVIAPDAANSRYVIRDNSVGGTINLTANAIANGATLQSANTAWVPFNKVTSTAANAITVNTLDGVDALTIDLSNGDLLNNVTFNGGNPTTSPGDSLTLLDTTLRTFPSVTHTPTSASGGTIAITSIANGARTVTYAGLEPITDGLLAANRTFQFTTAAETITLQDAGATNDGFNLIDSPLSEAITFRAPTTSLTINAGVAGADGDDIVLINRLDDLSNPTNGIQVNGGGGTNRITVATTDRPNPTNVYSFAGFTFDQTLTFNQAVKLAPADYNGVQVTADDGSPTNTVAFPETPSTGFADGLTIGRLLNDGSQPNTGARALNIPQGNVGSVVRSGLELSWNTAQSLQDQTGDDFVVYESSDFTDFDGYIVQVHQTGGGWSRWRYETPDSRQAYVGSATTGAFATAFDIASFGLVGTQAIDAIRIAGLTAADRIEGQGVETTVGSGVYRGQGFVVGDDGGVTSDTFPDPGPLASYTFFGNNTFDPDPLYVGMLHPLAAASNLHSDTIEVQDNQVRLVNQSITVKHAGFGELTVNSGGGIDRITVNLAGIATPAISSLPTNVIVNGGDPNDGDVLVVLGKDAAVDTLTLETSKITVTGGPTITVSAIERLEIDTAGDTNIDRVTIKRGFALAGVNPSIQVNGDGAFDELTVDTEAPAVAPSGATFTSAGVTFHQDATPNVFTSAPAGALLGGQGVVVNAGAAGTNSLVVPFPDSTVGFDASLSLGRLHSGGTGTRRLNIPTGDNGTTNRYAFTLQWSGSRTLENQAGDDIVIYEQGSGWLAGGGPEPYMIQIHDPDTDTWSSWRYHIVTSSTAVTGSEGEMRYAAVFDLNDFIVAGQFELAGGRIDAIRVANLVAGDRVSNASGEGFVLPSGTPGAATGFAPRAEFAGGPDFSSYSTFGSSTLDPDLVYLGITHALAAPQVQGVGDTVSIDANSVDVVGFIPIGYVGLNRVTVNTAGGADFIRAKLSDDTAYTLNMGDPTLASSPTDRLEFDLSGEADGLGNTGAVLTITDPGVGTLVRAGRRDVTVTGVDGFGIPPTTGTPATFDVVIDSASASSAVTNDVFVVDRDLALTRVTINNEIVFRGDVNGLRTLTLQSDISGESDNDTLTVDLANDDPIPRGGLFFHGGGGVNRLNLLNGSLEEVIYTATSATQFDVGTVDLDHFAANNAGTLVNLRSTITYTGLNATTHDELLTKKRTFEFSAADDHAQILDAAAAGYSQVINDPLFTRRFVDVEFLNPTAALTLNGGLGSDTLSLEGIDPAFAAAVNLYGGAGNDTFNIGGNGHVDFIQFPVNLQGNAPLDPAQPGGTGTANPTEDDRLFLDDSADVNGSIFSVTETTIGGENLPTGAAVGNTTPTINGAIDLNEWDHIPFAFESGARPGLNQQTILHWLTVDGTGRLLLDDSANNNDGALYAGPASGVFGNALEFDGVDDYAWFQDPTFDIGAEGTFSYWVFMDNQTRRNAFLNTSDSFPGEGFEVEYRENNGGELFAYLNKSDGSDNSLLLQNGSAAPLIPNAGQWFNIQLTWDFRDDNNPDNSTNVIEQAHLYIDGTEVVYRAGFGNPVTNWNQTVNTIDALMQLGRHRTDGTRNFDGKMDDVAFFNKALDTTQLQYIRTNDVATAQALYGGVLNPINATDALPDGALIAYWNLDNTAGQSVVAGNAGTNIDLHIEKITGGAEFIPNGGPTPPQATGPLNAVEFDGDEDAIRVGDSATLDFNKSQGTLAFWINPASEQTRNTLIGNTSTLFEDATGQFEVGISWQDDAGAALDHADLYGRVFFVLKGNTPNEPTNVFVSDSRLTFNDWTHVSIAWETVGGQLQAKMYFNGRDDGFLLNNLDATNLSAVNTGNWTVGGDAASAPLNRWFEGRLADVSLWGHALSAERVQHTFEYGAATTNAWDYSGAKAKFAWDANNLYGLVTDYSAGPGAANGEFNDLVVDLFDANGAPLVSFSPSSLNGAVIAPLAGSTGTYEFSVPLAALGFDPNSTSFLQYRIRTLDSNAVDLNNTPIVAGFDSGATTLGYVTTPLAGTADGLAKLNFVGRETLFGVGGRLTYHGLADVDLRTGSGVDIVTLSDDPLVNNDATANAARSFQLLTGAGADQVTIASLDAGYFAQTTIRTNADPLVPAADGGDTITQLAAFTLGSARSNGELWLEADQIRLDANSATKGAIKIDGAVTLTADVRLETTFAGSAGKDIWFTNFSTIDSETGEANNLVLDAAAGRVLFNADLGAAVGGELGRLEIERAAEIIFGQANTSTPATGQGPVTLVRVTGDGGGNGIDLGSAAVIGGGITLNGGTGNLLRLQTTGDAIRVNGAVRLATDVVFDTDTADNDSQGGEIRFTSAAPIDSAAQKNLAFDAGTASVFFNANLGEFQALGALTVDEADGGVTFGETSPVTAVNTTGEVNLGVGTNVIGGTGITLNGGGLGFTLTTTDQNVRFNGAVTLLSNVRIDTGSVGGGNIVFTSDSPLESPGQPRDLIMNAGTGTVEFDANVGAVNRLRKLTIEIAQKIIFGGADVAVTGGAGPVTAVRTDDAIDLGALAVVTDGVFFNGGANELLVSTTGDLIRVNGPTTLLSDVRFDTAGGNVFFTVAAPIGSDPSGGNDFTLVAAAGDITFSAAVGAVNPLDNLTILSADDVLFASVLQTTGAVTQSAGTGLTRFNGATGGGIGGALSVTTDRVEFGTSDVNATGAVNLAAQNAIVFLANAGLNAGASTITLFANQNGGPEGFTQDSSALIQTTNDTAAAVLITVGGSGDVRISRVYAGTATAGTITIVAGGAIIDYRDNEDPNLVAHTADLTAATGIGAMNADLDTALSFVTAFTATQDVVLDETNNITLRDITADTGTVFVNSGGVIAIQNGDVLESLTGRASNAPPLLTLSEDNPNDVLLPGDPTQEVRGQIGAGGLNAGNLEYGENFTLVVTWDDGQTSVLGGLSAGDTVVWLVDANNNSTVTVTPGAAPGPIDIFIQRTYPLPYLQLLNDTEVTANFTLFNDSRIQLFDATPINLNQTVTFGIASAISKKDFGIPTLYVLEEAVVVVEEAAGVILLETPPLVPVQQIIFRQDAILETKKEDEEAVLYLVRIGPDGAEGKRIRLPLEDLRDLARLLEKLKKTQMPSGLYRIYHQEPGLPARKVLEFRKAGNVIGDPIREPGRGANPQEESEQPGEGTNEAPAGEKPAGTGAEVLPKAAGDASQASLEAALGEVTAASFTRAARLRRRG